MDDLDNHKVEFDPDVLFRQTSDENISEEEQDDEIFKESSYIQSISALPVIQLPSTSIDLSTSSAARQEFQPSTCVRNDISTASNHEKVSVYRRRSESEPRVTKKRIWTQAAFTEKTHDYPTLPTKPVRRPIDYFNDYFDSEFLESISRCTNLYYLRTTGHELKSTGAEIARVLAIHIIMGCIPYPRVPMYWRAGTKLGLICDLMTRDRFLTLRDALHVVDSDSPSAEEIDNPLWKVQPMINKVKETCNNLKRVPGFYSIHEQMIPFTGRCKLRQVGKNKTRPVGLKNFVLTTPDGLMLDFEIYKGAKSNYSVSNLGLGPSVILHLVKDIPPNSCVYHDRYFTTVPLIEEMEKLGLHSTGTIMQNRIPDRASLKFINDNQMQHGQSQQFTCNKIAIVKWKDNNKSVLLASNCTAAEEQSDVKRWDKNLKEYVDISVPKIVRNYNQYMGRVDVLDQQTEYYRASIKTKNWTIKVILHFLDLSITNAWRLYRNDCLANKLPTKDLMPLLDFRMNVADSLSSTLDRSRRQDNEDDLPAEAPRQDYKKYRPAIAPSKAKRYDGYEHYPVADDIKAPRSCRLEECGSRSKTKCEKCDVYLCLTRDKNCFKTYHVTNM